MKEVINKLSSFIDSKQIFVEEENIDDIRRLIEYVIVLERKLKDIKSQLDYLETYSSKEDVFEDMKRRLDRIDKIIGGDKK